MVMNALSHTIKKMRQQCPVSFDIFKEMGFDDIRKMIKAIYPTEEKKSAQNN